MVNRNSWRGGLFGKGSRRRTFLRATSKVRPDSREGAGHSSQQEQHLQRPRGRRERGILAKQKGGQWD